MTPSWRWQRFELTLACTQASARRRAHPLEIFEAIVKGISEALALTPPRVRTVFRWRGRRATDMRLRLGEPIPLEVSLFGASDEEAQRWHEQACAWFDLGAPGRNFTVLEAKPIEIHTAAQWLEASYAPTDEIALDFLTPLPFAPSKARSRTWIDGAGFVQLIEERLRRLFGDVPLLPPAPEVIPAYWEYIQIEHPSHSQPGHVKYLNGCIGPLLLRGPHLLAWLPWLALFEQTGLGARISFGQGMFRLAAHAPPILDAALTDPNRIRKRLEELQESNPEILLKLGPERAEALSQLAESIAQRLREGHTPQPFEAFDIPRPDGRVRRIEMPDPLDGLILRHLARLLEEPFERLFSAHSIGYRKGRSREDAVSAIRAAIEEGYAYVLESDIQDFFPSVDLERLAQRLDDVLPHRDVRLRRILLAYLHVPWRNPSGVDNVRRAGLPQGSPLSPLLANLYLDGFDSRLSDLMPGVRLIRYADDFVILARSQADAERLLAHASDAAAALGLALNLDKTAIHTIHEGFTFLGIHFGGDLFGERANDEVAHLAKKVLYLTEPYAFVGLEQESLTIELAGKRLGAFPLVRTSAVVALVPCSVSSALVAALAKHQIPLTLTDPQTHQILTLGGDSARRFERAARQSRHHADLGEHGRLAVAIQIVKAKLANYLTLIRERATEGTADVAKKLSEAMAAIESAPSLDALRGYEGQSAHALFPLIASWIRVEGFPWQGRRRHGEHPDRLNSLLNFGYHLLFTRINAILRAQGLNPYLGYLHEANGRFEALASDLVELFRPYVDRLIVRLLNLRVITADDFIETEHGWWLMTPARREFLRQFAREMERRPIRRRHSLGERIEWQIEVLTAWIEENQTLTLHRMNASDE